MFQNESLSTLYKAYTMSSVNCNEYLHTI